MIGLLGSRKDEASSYAWEPRYGFQRWGADRGAFVIVTSLFRPLARRLETTCLKALADLLPRSGVVNHPGHGDGVQGTVEAIITAAVESMPGGVTA
jgi:hypothetical protein